jgi:hypothetical protein
MMAMLAVWPLGAGEPTLPLKDITPGMEGIGRTVFEGSRVEDFKVHILGVLQNIIGPSRSLILARLEGGPLATTGVIAGMSGSPVYIDGRLIGAVSYSLGHLARGDRGHHPDRRDGGRHLVYRSTPVHRAGAARAPRHERVAHRDPPAGVRPDVCLRALPQRRELLRTISLELVGRRAGCDAAANRHPLVLSGFSGDTAVDLANAFGRSGFQPVAGAVAGSASAIGEPASAGLAPGDPIGVGLVDGDLSLGATGTVTNVVDNRVYAFGHPFFNLGPTTFPMTQAFVHVVLPSLLSSSKIASLGRIVGTVEQDRATAIAGTLGRAPSMLPVHLALETDRGPRREFKFTIVRDQLFTPLLTYLSLVNTLKSYEREFGSSSFTVKGRALVAGHGQIAFEDLFTGDSPSIGAASYIAGPLAFLLTNDVEPVEIDALDLTIVSSEMPRTAELERVWIDAPSIKPGKTVPVKVLVRTYRGDEVTQTVPVEIPVNASGSLTLLVADGARLTQWEQREIRRPQQARDVAQMVKAFNKARKNNASTSAWSAAMPAPSSRANR